jgi:hypothetical protein
MSARAATRLALLGLATCLVLAVGAVVFYGLSPSVEYASEAGPREIVVGLAIAFVAYATVGALIVSRRPDNRVGWLLLLVALGFEMESVADGYAAYTLVAEPGALPGGETAAWLSSWIWVPGLTLTTTLLLLLFPTGRLLSRRWRAVVALAVLAGTMLTLYGALAPEPVDTLEAVDVENPYGIVGIDAVVGAGWILLPLAALCSAAGLLFRYRRSRGEERLQLKWFVTAAVLLAVALIVGFMSGDAIGGNFIWLLVVAVAMIPVAVGIAIFKHGLYEIDLIIRRTLVYGVLSALLAGLYFGIVLALQAVFSSFTGGSDLAIAISTLAVAALFRPVRSGIQQIVDRRFYRAKYDAERTLEAFSARLRDEIDLDALADELRDVVQETMQPAHVSLWLRAPGVMR